jgi:pimeloyl-ACP methyl ester carboxylesterase
MTQQLALLPQGPMEYRLEGAGPAVVILNGGHCSRFTRLSHERLVHDGFTVLTPSRPGYDATPAATGPSAQGAADAIAVLLKMLNLPTAAVIGISAAGPTALALAVRHPERVNRLIVESAVTLPWSGGTKRGARLVFGRTERHTWRLIRAALRLAPSAVIRLVLQELTTLPVHDVLARMSPDDLEFVRRMLAASQSGQGFIHDLEHRVTDLSGIDMPVLAMYSPHDRAVPPRHARHIQATIPRSQLFEVPADSHLIWIGPDAGSVWQRRLDFLHGA